MSTQPTSDTQETDAEVTILRDESQGIQVAAVKVNFARSLETRLKAALAEVERLIHWKEHAAESDKEFLQLEDWLIGNAEIDLKTGLIDRAAKCKERIRDLVANEAELIEARQTIATLQQENAALMEVAKSMSLVLLDCKQMLQVQRLNKLVDNQGM